MLEKIAVWETEPAQWLVSGLELRGEVEIVTAPPSRCQALVRNEEVDVALVPPVFVYQDPEPWEVIPGVGLASSRYPYAQLYLGDTLNEIGRIGFDPRYQQEALLTQIVVKEHYQTTPEFVPVEDEGPASAFERIGNYLVTGSAALSTELPGTQLDVGREWFELSTFPATWGVLASPVERLDIEEVRHMVETIQEAEGWEDEWIKRHELSVDLEDFFHNALYTRLTGEVDRGLEELTQYMFFHGMLEDIPQMPFIIFPEDREEQEEEES